MAGNIVKWWKHKILGGYKQFTVLQECATDSEELIYPVRAPSACSAPPDLLLTSDREQMLKVKSSKQHQQQQSSHNHQSSQQQQQNHHKNSAMTGGQQQQQHKESSFRKCSGRTPTVKSDPDRVRLEEFTCDVSLEDGKKPQPLQFSFTLYDLDGHGKITKDDIAGIVSTIYESIGKSVVVPHYGSKTINVRLTVSPDGKTKQTASAVKKAAITPRRRYRPRKLISDDDGSDTSENCPRVMRTRANTVVANTTINNNVKHKDNNVAKDEDVVDGLTKSSEAVETTFHNNLNGKGKTLNVKNDKHLRKHQQPEVLQHSSSASVQTDRCVEPESGHVEQLHCHDGDLSGLFAGGVHDRRNSTAWDGGHSGNYSGRRHQQSSEAEGGAQITFIAEGFQVDGRLQQTEGSQSVGGQRELLREHDRNNAGRVLEEFALSAGTDRNHPGQHGEEQSLFSTK
ncbi:protein naked cuticle homolog [Aedes aegypti]|uniref:Protein naked cuticle homolog n=1 Tax=Aedes aegypti TaxID=7159 RepID=A0A6I8U9S5_AEDAE|nr:protein naked cuticle homolog [Aedes aegypti]